MSSTILKLIPTEPTYVPDKLRQQYVKVLLEKLYPAEQIKFISTQTVEFIDQGQNFENVSCNLCGRNIEKEDWQNAMDRSYEYKFTDLTFITPCCGATTSLNALHYNLPAGFAKFVISIPGAQNSISEKDLDEMQKILGTTLRIIWAHY